MINIEDDLSFPHSTVLSKIELFSLMSRKIFLWYDVEEQKAVGMLIAHLVCTDSFHLTPRNNLNMYILITTQIIVITCIRPIKGENDHLFFLGIQTLWVHESFRRRGVASALVKQASMTLVPGMTFPPKRTAFSATLSGGDLFAQSYTGVYDYLVFVPIRE